MKTANVVEAVPTPITQKTPDQPVQKTPVRPVNTPIVQLTPNAPVQNTPVKPTVNATAMKLAQTQQQQQQKMIVSPATDIPTGTPVKAPVSVSNPTEPTTEAKPVKRAVERSCG